MTHQEYMAITTSPETRQAEASVRGVLRGGHVAGGVFLFCGAGGRNTVPLSEVRDLRFAPYTSED